MFFFPRNVHTFYSKLRIEEEDEVLLITYAIRIHFTVKIMYLLWSKIKLYYISTVSFLYLVNKVISQDPYLKPIEFRFNISETNKTFFTLTPPSGQTVKATTLRGGTCSLVYLLTPLALNRKITELKRVKTKDQFSLKNSI